MIATIGLLLTENDWLTAQDALRPESPSSMAAGREASPVGSAILSTPQKSPYGEAVPVIDAQSGPTVNANGDVISEVSAVPKRFQYALRLDLRAVRDDNIFLTDSNPVSDFYFALEGGVTLGFGDIVGQDANYVRFDYAPSVFLFFDNSDADAVTHLLRLEGHYKFGRLGLSMSQDVQLLDGANFHATLGPNNSPTNPAPGLNLDAGNTAWDTYTTRANLTYDLTGKTFLSGGLFYIAYDYETLIDSQTISGNLFLNYIYSSKLTVGLGGTGGYDRVDSSNPDQTFEQINLRLIYQLSGKISLNASGGVEFRQFEGSQGESHTSPVYEMSTSYQPFDGTTIDLRGAGRSLNSAVLQAQNYNSTTLSVGARQRLLRRIYLGLTCGYENLDYYSTSETTRSDRTDDYFFIQPSVDVTLTSFWTAGIFYLHRANSSSSEPYSFHDNQVGLRTSLTY